MIRKAVGAVIQYDGKILLVHKVKGAQGKIAGKWDFPKGGIESHDTNLEQALLRELKEETGSNKYVILDKFKENICFDFDQITREKIGFEKQETTMFFVEYKGDGSDLIPEDEEIDDVQFFRNDEVSELLFPESRDFFEKFIQNK